MDSHRSKKDILGSNIFTGVFILLVILVIILFMRDRRLILQGFSTEAEIKTELDKQFKLMNDFKFPTPSDIQSRTAIPVMPNMEIIKRYKNSANQMLGPIEETVKKDIADKEAELQTLNEYVSSLNEYANRDFLNRINTRDIRTIKSHNNGLELAVNKTMTGPANKYQVHVNGGCLKVPFTNDAIVVPCNNTDPDQVFSLDNVFNEPGYRAKMDTAFPQLDNLGNVRYPFSILRAKSNGNCLKNYHGSLSVEPCREYEGQRWASTEKQGGFCPP